MKQDALVILSQREQEYLLHAIEAVMPVRQSSQFGLWTQGQLQALLPHQIMVTLQFGAQYELQQLECLHATLQDSVLLTRLSHRQDGLALRLAQHYRAAGCMPAMLEVGAQPGLTPELAAFQQELRSLGLDNVLLHGTECLPGGATCFVLFGMPHRPRPRHAYFLELLLPYLHLALQRVNLHKTLARRSVLQRAPSARELEILHWVREGKSNDEIGQILSISGNTVRNHLQRLFRLLGVSNRAHAIACGISLQLFDVPARPRALAG